MSSNETYVNESSIFEHIQCVCVWFTIKCSISFICSSTNQPTNQPQCDIKFWFERRNNLKKAERTICLARFGYKHETRVCDSFYKALTNSETINNSRIKRFSHGLHRILIYFLFFFFQTILVYLFTHDILVSLVLVSNANNFLKDKIEFFFKRRSTEWQLIGYSFFFLSKNNLWFCARGRKRKKNQK